MAFDGTSRALAIKALSNTLPTVEQYGGQSSLVAPPYSNTAAFRDAFAVGPAKIALIGDYFPVAALATTEPVRTHWISQQPAILLPQQLKLFDGCGATLALSSSLGIVGAPYASYAYPEVRSDLAADVAVGDTTLTLAAGEGSKWSAGDTFLYRFGSLPFDLPEPLYWGFGTVRGVAGDVLTIDAPMPQAFALASVAALTFADAFGTAGLTNKTLRKWPLIADLTIRNLKIVGDPQGNAESGVFLQGARRVALRDVACTTVGSGFLLQYVDGALLDGCSMLNSSQPGNASLNKGIGIAETRGIEIRQFVCGGVSTVVGAEANSQATVVGGRFDNTGNPATGASYGPQCVAFLALGLSQLTVRDFTLTGFGGYLLSEVANGVPAYDGRVRFEGGLTLIHDTMPASIGRLIDMDCLLDLRIAGAREVWDFAHPRWVKRRIYLRNGLYQSLGLPPGILRQARVYASQGCAPGTALTDFYIGRTNDNGSTCITQLVAGETVTLPFTGDGSALFQRRSEQLKLLVITASGSALDASAEFVDIECEIVPNLLAPAFAWSAEEDVRAIGPGEGLREALFTGYDLASLPAGGTQQVDFAVPTMAAGDFVEFDRARDRPRRGDASRCAVPGGALPRRVREPDRRGHRSGRRKSAHPVAQVAARLTRAPASPLIKGHSHGRQIRQPIRFRQRTGA